MTTTTSSTRTIPAGTTATCPTATASRLIRVYVVHWRPALRGCPTCVIRVMSVRLALLSEGSMWCFFYLLAKATNFLTMRNPVSVRFLSPPAPAPSPAPPAAPAARGRGQGEGAGAPGGDGEEPHRISHC